MRIGLIARADRTGLGNQCLEFARHMNPDKTLVVDLCHLSPKKLTLHPERFTNPVVVRGNPDKDALEEFVKDLDIIYTAETPYNYELFSIAEEHGVKTVLHMNPEFNDYFLSPQLPRPTVIAAPTHWMLDSIPDPKIVLPVPVAVERFQGLWHETSSPTRFLHVVGNPAIHDRAGTRDLLAAIPHLTQPCIITVKCQEPGYVSLLIEELKIKKPPGVTLIVDSGTVEDYRNLYTNQDVLVHPRRFGGLNLPAQEALAAGMVVLMPYTSPNDDLLPGDWLFTCTRYGQFMARQPVDLYRTEPHAIASIMDRFADRDYTEAQRKRAHLYAEPLCWEDQKLAYDSVFENIVAGNIPMAVTA